MKLESGFSTVELLVSIAIMVTITSIVLFNYSAFNDNIIINRAARELGHAFRDAQARAVAISEAAGVFPKSYGVRVSDAGGSNTEFIIFTDSNSNEQYDPPGSGCSGECIKKFNFTNGVTISEIERPNPTPPPKFLTDKSALDVLFKRPDPKIEVYDGSGGELTGSGVNGPFQIHVRSLSGLTKKVDVWITGQISIVP